jgi:hypothetical protein
MLANLHVLAEGQTPAAEDIAKADRIIDPVFAQFAACDIAYVPDAGGAERRRDRSRLIRLCCERAFEGH